ncbi:UDP-galactose-lipid carrier transferase (EC [Olavius algarvensis associated proteobacterium Delta 3]|nr:UDP-galactose-lipid carrier transferase (EC [Olavius algarvensis associated proteobacterium Delta 3]CAB5135932.1 UDP-galactose-lipid carrier transferase (EC [Olavius algarvensis associated proteobacterium Delta 3]
MKSSKFKVPQGKKVKLSDYRTDDTGDIESKKDASKLLKANTKKMAELQDRLYAHDRYGLLMVFQAMDAAGKDSTIKHVMSGLNPQGTQVFSFKQPSAEELDHGYLWRIAKAVPERGRIGIFNRSHYEDVLVVRVHDLVKFQKIPDKFDNDGIWKERFNQIKNFETYLYENGIITIKFFLHISKDEQRKRFLRRLDIPSKNWKFSEADLKEREHWEDYQKCYEEAISATSTDYAPWYIIPADKKWFARVVVSNVIIDTLQSLKLMYPELDGNQKRNIHAYREQLMKE